MVNSKGGFLVDDGKEVDEDLRAKERERERQRAMQNADPRESNLARLIDVSPTVYSNVSRCISESEMQGMQLNRR